MTFLLSFSWIIFLSYCIHNSFTNPLPIQSTNHDNLHPKSYITKQHLVYYRNFVSIDKRSTRSNEDRSRYDDDEAPGRVFYSHRPPARLTRGNISVRESDIAAIFRGVAHGVPTESALMHRPPIQSKVTTQTTALASSMESKSITQDDTQMYTRETGSVDHKTTHSYQNTTKSSLYSNSKNSHVIESTTNIDDPYNIGFPTTIRLLIPPKLIENNITTVNELNHIPSTTELNYIFPGVFNFGKSTRTISNRDKIPFNDTLHSVAPLEKTKKIENELGPHIMSPSPIITNITTTQNSVIDYTNDTLNQNRTSFSTMYNISIIYNWKEIQQYLSDNIHKLWEIYIYSVSAAYSVIALTSFYRLIVRFRSLPFFIHMSFYSVVFGSSLIRALIVLWDPYKGQRILPEMVLSALYIAGEPGVGVVMSSFIVLLLNIFYGMIALPVIIASCSALEMGTGLFVELASKHFAIYIGNFSQEYLDTFSFIVGLGWNGIVCISYIILISSRRFRKHGRRRSVKDIQRRKDDETSSDILGKSYQISGYCFAATFVQLFMVALYAYVLLHPHELLTRPNELKEKWVLFQVLERILEVVVYCFLLVSVRKIDYRNTETDIVSTNTEAFSDSKCCLGCCRSTSEQNSNRINGKRKSLSDTNPVNNINDGVNHCSTDDFQLVWSRNSNKDTLNSENLAQSMAHIDKKDSAKKIYNKTKSTKPKISKTKKRKTKRERDEMLQEREEQEMFLYSACAKENIHPKRIDIHNNTSRDYKKYQSVRNKFDIQDILDAKLPIVDTSLHKYMGVTLPQTGLRIQNNSIPYEAESFLRKSSDQTANQDVLEEIENITKQVPKLPKQFWSPQHKPSKSAFKNLPPLPLRAQTPINLPSLPPLNLIPVAPSNLAPIKPCQFPGRNLSSEVEDPEGMEMNVDSHTPDFEYATNKEFVRDFAGGHPSPFSERLSSADLGTVSSFSEMRVDYLTDLSSADGASIGSLSYYRASRMSVNNISDHGSLF